MNHNHCFAICAYKESPYLQACIDSLKQQTAKSKIIICTSTPNEFLKNIAKKNSLELKINPKATGIASDWNFSLSQANAKFVTLAHQDDIYFPDYLENILHTLNKNPDSLIAYTNYQEIVHGKSRVYIRNQSLNLFIKKLINLIWYGGKETITRRKDRLLRLGSPIGCPAVTYNLGELKHFRFSTTFSINMDWYAWYQLSKMKGSFAWINQTLMSHRIHIDSETSHGLAQNRRQQEDQRMFDAFWPHQLSVFLSRLYALSYKSNI